MRFLAIILVMTSFGCTTTNHSLTVVDKEPYHYIDSAFRSSVHLFETMAVSRGIVLDDSNLSITFGMVRNAKSSVVGTCQLDALGIMIIKVHDESWAKMGPYEREELIFHELGHCILARPHCTAKDKGGMPISLMYPTMTPKDHYKKNRKEMINELFDFDPRCKKDDDDADELHGTIRIPSDR